MTGSNGSGDSKSRVLFKPSHGSEKRKEKKKKKKKKKKKEEKKGKKINILFLPGLLHCQEKKRINEHTW